MALVIASAALLVCVVWAGVWILVFWGAIDAAW